MPKSNIVRVQAHKSYKFYIWLALQFFSDENCKEVELHGAGGTNLFTVIKLGELLTAFGYCSISKIKTKFVATHPYHAHDSSAF